MKRKSTIELMVKELLNISSGISKGLAHIVLPVKKPKPKWCQCKKCGGWHFEAK